MKKAEKSSKKIQKKIKSVTVVTFWPYPPPPYFQPKSKCVLNDSEWLETHFKHVFEKCDEDRSWPPPPNVKNVPLFFFFLMKASLTNLKWNIGIFSFQIWKYFHDGKGSLPIKKKKKSVTFFTLGGGSRSVLVTLFKNMFKMCFKPFWVI